MQKKTVQPPAKTFFFGDHVLLARKNSWIWDFGQQKKRLKIGEDLFFGDHMFLAGENPWICDFGQKKRLNLGKELFFWRSNKIGSNFQKSLSLCKILATPLIFIKGGFRFSRCVALPFARSFEENKTYKRGLHSCESVNAEAVTYCDHACWWNGFHNVALRRVYVRAVLGRDWSKTKKVDHS